MVIESEFSENIVINGSIQYKSIFEPRRNFPNRYSITTPFTFPFYNNKVVLTKDKNFEWNPLGGHIEEGENWRDTIIRESYEEAGIVIDKRSIYLIGYLKIIKLLKHPDNKYPYLSLIPITRSIVKKYDKNWVPRETLGRKCASYEKAMWLLSKRDDNNQMLKIFMFILKNK